MKQLFTKSILWLVPLTLLVAGCKPQQTEIVPPDIHYGLQTCADCGMIISDSHYAAAIAFREKPDTPVQTKAFDDIGCMLSWRKHHADAQIGATWVKDVKTAVWLDATSAVYVKSDQLSTPMGSGVVAGIAKADFSKLPIQKPVLTWTNLLNAAPMQSSRMTMTQK